MTVAQRYFDLVLDIAPDAVAAGHRPRVGTDVQTVAPVLASLRGPHRAAYLARLFTPDEVADCGLGTAPDEVVAESLAARFAVKEAVVKILRPGEGATPRPPWTDIEIRRGPGGWPELRLTGSAAVLADSACLTDWSCSFTHDDGLALATVIALLPACPRPRKG